ncbi:RNA 2',3'-cyclic phosphodiesterase [Chloroflexota bacterium]
MEPVRSFIAIDLPDEVKRALAQIQTQIKLSDLRGVKWVNPYGIHLTLQFLGNVSLGKLDEISGAITNAGHGIPPFHLAIKGLGVFPNLKRVQVVWVGIDGEIDKLINLQKLIEINLTPLGFTPEKRAFTPHLTVARLRNEVTLDERQRLGQVIANTRFEKAYDFEVDAVNLMKSQLTKEGAIYSRISSVRLEKSLPKDNA